MTDPMHSAVLTEWTESDEPLLTPEQALRMLCILQSEVSQSGVTDFPSVAADCWCEWRRMKDGFRNQGDSLRFIVRATRNALGDHGDTTVVAP